MTNIVNVTLGISFGKINNNYLLISLILLWNFSYQKSSAYMETLQTH